MLVFKGKQGKSYLSCAVRGGLTDPGSRPSQAPNPVSAGSKAVAHMTVFKHCLASLSLKILGVCCAMCIFW